MPGACTGEKEQGDKHLGGNVLVGNGFRSGFNADVFISERRERAPRPVLEDEVVASMTGGDRRGPGRVADIDWRWLSFRGRG